MIISKAVTASVKNYILSSSLYKFHRRGFTNRKAAEKAGSSGLLVLPLESHTCCCPQLRKCLQAIKSEYGRLSKITLGCPKAASFVLFFKMRHLPSDLINLD